MHIKKDELIYKQGARSDYFYGIVKGKVGVLKKKIIYAKKGSEQYNTEAESLMVTEDVNQALTTNKLSGFLTSKSLKRSSTIKINYKFSNKDMALNVINLIYTITSLLNIIRLKKTNHQRKKWN